MALAAVIGLHPRELSEIEEFSPKVDVANVMIIGVRNVDAQEKENIKKSGLRVVTMKELDMRGMKSVMQEALQRAGDGTAGFHYSFDS